MRRTPDNTARRLSTRLGPLAGLTFCVAISGGCSAARSAPAEAIPAVVGQSPTDASLASAVDIRAIGCKAEAVRGAGALIIGGYIVTAAHVVAGALSVSVQPAATPDAKTYAATVVVLDPANDLALLIAPELHLGQLSVGTLRNGDTGVATVFRDAPLQQPFTVDRPVVVHILDIYGKEKIDRLGFQVNMDVLAGDSGSVLVGPDGSAGAVLYAKSRSAKNRAWAVGLDSLPSMIKAADKGPLLAAPVGECAA